MTPHGPDQTVRRRIVIFEGSWGRLFLRDSHDLLLESLGDCAISDEPAVQALDTYHPPPMQPRRTMLRIGPGSHEPPSEESIR